MSFEELTGEYRGIVERIPDYIIEAAKGRIRVNGIKGSIAKRILLKNDKPADTIMKSGDGEQEHHLEEAEWE